MRLVSRFALIAILAAGPSGIMQSQVDSAPAREPDVRFVPTDVAVVHAMIDVAGVGREDVIYDLGCGDGRIVIAAVKLRGARGVCVDIDPVRIAESRQNADTAGVMKRIVFRVGDLFEMDLRDATVVSLYLLPSLNVRLRPKLFRELRPGVRVVSNGFDMGDWAADSVLEVKNTGGFNSFVYFWAMPADVSGVWDVKLARNGARRGGEVDYVLRLDQRYQAVSGTADAGGRRTPITGARLRGRQLSFTIESSGGRQALQFKGNVTGDKIAGAVSEGGGEAQPFSSVRTERGPRPEIEAVSSDQ